MSCSGEPLEAIGMSFILAEDEYDNARRCGYVLLEGMDVVD